MAQDTDLDVLVVSDFVCPFCHVGRERAAWLRDTAGATIHWLPFDLHPEYPPEGISRDELLARYGEAFAGMVKDMAQQAGLPFAPHPERVPRTRRALELAEWARGQGEAAHDRLHERIMDAYWAESRDISEWDVLADCLRDVGLDTDEGRSAVESGAHAEAVDVATAWAQSHGINAVPSFIFAGRVLVSGAAPHEDMARAVAKARELVAADRPE